jgi:uncharacterized protein YjiS (DUF1127 family)
MMAQVMLIPLSREAFYQTRHFDGFHLSPDWPAPPQKRPSAVERSLSKEIAMTILNSHSSYSTALPAFRRAFGIFLARLARFINRWIAAVIAHREHQANLVVLRSLSDRELKDIGLHRGELGDALAEAAKVRSRMQSRPSDPWPRSAVGE